MKKIMTKKNRREKWRNTPITSQNIDEYMNDFINETKGQYITQGVSFNKDDSLEMELLKKAILSYGSFSGLCKYLLTHHFEGISVELASRTFPVAVKHEGVVVSEEKESVYSKPSEDTLPPERTVENKEQIVTKQLEKKRLSPARKFGGGSSFQANPNAKPPKGSPY